MAEAKSSQGSQAVQTVLVVFISVLITALLVLLWGGRKGGESSFSLTSSTIEGETNKQIADRLVQDSALLSQRLATSDNELEMALAAREAAESARDSITDQIIDYKNKINELQKQLAEGVEALSEIEALKFKNTTLEQEAIAYLAEITELRNANQTDLYKAQNTKLMAELAELRNKLEDTQDELLQASKDSTDNAALEGQLVAYKNQNRELQKQIADLRFQLNRTMLFVEESSQLDPRATKLFASLKALRTANGVALNMAYSAIETNLNVKKIRHIKFAEGSAFVSELEEGLISADLQTTESESFFLVVGYASTTGSADLNRSLSAKRATATAAVVHKLKSQGQEVRAVFLGQTDRFSEEVASENQICEIWEIKK